MGPVNQTVLISEQLLDAKSLLPTANTTTPYTILYLDTKDGSLVLEIPSEALVPMDEGWFRCVTDVGITGPTRARAVSTSYCLPATREQFRTAISLRVRALLEICCFSEPS